MPVPEFVVVEEADGGVYAKDSSGRLLSEQTAQELADELAVDRKPGRPGPAVYRLARVAAGTPRQVR